MSESEYFQDIVGQNRAKKLLSLYVDFHKQSGFIKPLFICAKRGAGKTLLARTIARNLKSVDNKPKPMVEVNGASIRSLRGFIEGVIIPHVNPDRYLTVFIDEIHSVHPDALDWLLTVLQLPEKGAKVTHNFFDGIQYTFDFNKLSFISASTNPEMLGSPLKTRLRKIELENYTPDELKQMLNNRFSNIKFNEKSDEDIVSVCRGIPRILLENIGDDVQQYCAQTKKDVFDKKDWNTLRKILGLKPFGLTISEVEALSFLKESGPSSLKGIAAHLGLDSKTVMLDTEIYLLNNGFIKIDQQRHITQKGQEALDMVIKDK